MNLTDREKGLIVVIVVLAALAAYQWSDLRTAQSQVAELRAELPRLAHEEALATLSKERRADLMKAGAWLNSYYRSPEGLQRPEGLWINGQPDWEGIGAWLFDGYLRERVLGRSDAEARIRVIDAIQRTDEWKSKHAAGK